MDLISQKLAVLFERRNCCRYNRIAQILVILFPILVVTHRNSNYNILQLLLRGKHINEGSDMKSLISFRELKQLVSFYVKVSSLLLFVSRLRLITSSIHQMKIVLESKT